LLLLVILYHSKIIGIGLKEIREYLSDQIESIRETRNSIIRYMMRWTQDKLELNSTLTEMSEVHNLIIEEKKKIKRD
jgi:hypothetical protein